MADVPGNSHFEASVLTSFMTNPRSQNPIWLSNSFSTYLLLKPNSSFVTVDEKIPAMLEKYVGPEVKQFMGISIEDFIAQGNKYRFSSRTQGYSSRPINPAGVQEASDPKYL
jgi:putative ABC transport system permease protein